MNIKAGDVVVHKLGERLLVLEVNQQDDNCYRYLKCRRPNFDIVTIKDREIAGLEPTHLLVVPEVWTPDQIRQIQKRLDDYLSYSARLNKIKFVPGGVRNEWTIFRFLSRLEDLWVRYPQLRLGQLIGNVFNYALGKDPYNVEDEDFISALEEFYGKEGGVQ